ncbi:MAG TPA: protein kinase [Blastocatellia bacterium]|nr:protein kinase [Blastocatellia bacterium]
MAVGLQAEARDQYLAEACGNDASLRAEVEKLLWASDHSGSFIEKPLLDISGDASSDDLQPGYIGRQIGAYQVLQEIGRGGMGTVFLAARADGEYRKKVAIKILQPEVGKKEVERFRRERQILADLDHHNIARLIDAGTIDGLPWIAMDYIEGKNLRTLIEEQGAMPVERVVEITKQICSGLAAAHEIGVIHRDIKPENIIVNERENLLSVKILDFGIARSNYSEAKSNITNTGMIMGTAAYMSPEQSGGTVGQKIDTRSDIYSLGTVIYEMLTGLKVFEGNAILDVLMKHRYEKPLALRKRRPDLYIPETIERVVLKALEKDRLERHQAVTDLAAELEKAFRKSQEYPSHGKVRAFGRLALGFLTVVACIAIINVVWLRTISTPAAPLTSALATSLANGPVEILKYRLEVIDKNRLTRTVTDDEPLKPTDGFKFHFTSNESGYLYMVANKNDKPTVFLSGRKNPQSDDPTNQIEAGKDFSFPAEREQWIGVKSQIQKFTIIFSNTPLGNPAFLRAEPLHELTPEESDEFERLRWKSAIEIELKVVKGTVAIPADRALLRPLIFDIPIRLK